MYGLEKKGRALFEFDMEKELKEKPGKMKELLQHCETRIQEVKNILRQGTASSEYDSFGVLLHGYVSLQKVLTRMANKK